LTEKQLLLLFFAQKQRLKGYVFARFLTPEKAEYFQALRRVFAPVFPACASFIYFATYVALNLR
jgi:hypothetical protein